MFDFKDFDYLTDGEIDLVIDEKTPGNFLKGYVPAYKYHIKLHKKNDAIGIIDIRIGYNQNIYLGGNIGYEVKKAFRGHNYAAKACRLLKQVALAHGLNEIYITCNPDNIASIKTIQKVGGEFLKIAKVPPFNEMYDAGEYEKAVYIWKISD